MHIFTLVARLFTMGSIVLPVSTKGEVETKQLCGDGGKEETSIPHHLPHSDFTPPALNNEEKAPD